MNKLPNEIWSNILSFVDSLKSLVFVSKHLASIAKLELTHVFYNTRNLIISDNFYSSLVHKYKLQHISLTFCCTAENMSFLCQGIRQTQTLKSLNFEIKNALDKDSAQALLDLFSTNSANNNNYTRFEWRSHGVSNESVAILSQALAYLQKLEHFYIDLYCKQVVNDFIEEEEEVDKADTAIASCLSHYTNHLASLCSKNRLGKFNGLAVAKSIYNLKKLVKLHLIDNNFEDATVTMIAKAIGNLSDLQELFFKGNISEEAAQAFCTSFPKLSQKLKKLAIGKCKNEKSAILLVAGLRALVNLNHLSLRENTLTETVAFTLASTISVLKQLHFLDLHECNISQTGGTEIVKILCMRAF